MPVQLFHICGPFAIQSYGIAIVAGIIIFTLLIERDPRFNHLGLKKFFTPMLLWGIIAAIIGGRIIYRITEPDTFTNITDLFMLWEGGFSVLGAVLGVLCVVPWFLYWHKAPILPVLDLIAIYGPLLQSIARLGCFFAGCCYGAPATVRWTITYTDPLAMAPLHVPLHPAQLYSSFTLFSIFCLMYFFLRHRYKKPGQLTTIYLVLLSIERFTVDFWRADQTYFAFDYHHLLSANQWIALSIATSAILGLMYITTCKRSRT